MKSFKKFRSLIFDPARKINERIFLLLVFIAMIMLFIALIGDALYNNSLVEIITIIALIIIICTTTALGVKTDRLDIVIKATSVVIMLAIPVVFLFAGGAEGAAILWFVFYYMFIGLVLTGWWRIINIIILTILVGVLFFVEYSYPGFVPKYTRWVFYLDTSLAVVEVGLVCFAMSWFQNRLFLNENKRAKEEMKKAEDLNRSQNRFFSSMSHEIRTPINSILGLNEIILRQDDVSDEIKKDAEYIQGAGKMLLALINDILDFSKIEAGRMDIVPVNYSFASMVSEIVNMIWLRAEQKGLDFKIEVDPSIPSELFGDEVRIKQILINLLNNAVKYTTKGSVTLHIEKEDINEESVLLMFSVIDTGSGIKQDAIPYLFDAFMRVDEVKNNRIEGTGLGLSIVKQLVDLMDGRVTVNSIYTQGSTFTVTLWQKITRFDAVGNIHIEGMGMGVDDTAYEAHFTARDVKILIVDDNEMNLEVEKKLLNGTGITVETAISGEEALIKTMTTRYDMILMDHLMPKMDGIECMQHIRKQAGGLNNHVPFIVLTANAGSENRELYVDSGFDGYLVKPITGNQLEDMILMHIPESKITSNNVRETSLHLSTSRSYSRKIPVLVASSSSCDIPISVIRDQQIDTIPYNISVDGKIYYDMIEAGPDELLRYIKAGKEFSVNAPSVEEFETFFANELKKAHIIVYITLSSALSSEYKRAKEAAKAYGNVNVFDSGLASSGAGLLVLTANRLSIQGKSPEKILEVLEVAKNRIRSAFVTSDVYFLRGKVFSAEGIFNIFKLFNVRPFIRGDFGKSMIRKISLGNDRKRCHERFVDFALPGYTDPDDDILVVTYAGISSEDLEYVKSRIQKKHEFKKIVFVKGSSTFVLNSGSGALGIAYFVKSDFAPGLSTVFTEDAISRETEQGTDEIAEFKGAVEDEETDIRINEGKWYDNIPGINRSDALRNSGTEDTLRNMFEIFYESIEDKYDELERYYKNEEWDNYTVKVHALKSSARLIGANELADNAAKLEEAGKREDIDYIKSHNRDFLEDYRQFGEVLRPIFEKTGMIKADRALIDITYETIREALDKNDKGAVMEAFNDISVYELPDEDAIKMEQLKDLFDEGDLDTMKALMD